MKKASALVIVMSLIIIIGVISIGLLLWFQTEAKLTAKQVVHIDQTHKLITATDIAIYKLKKNYNLNTISGVFVNNETPDETTGILDRFRWSIAPPITTYQFIINGEVVNVTVEKTF